MNHSRKQTFKSKVLNDLKPFYKDKAQNKIRPIRTNTKRPIKIWVPKSEIIFSTYMLKGKNKATISVPEQWLTTIYNKRKSYIPNPNSEEGRKCRI